MQLELLGYGSGIANLLKIREAAEALGGCVSTTTLWRQCRAGEIPAIRIGSRWLIPAWWVDELGARPVDGNTT